MNESIGIHKERSLNTILYGPPGTGKTHAIAKRCVEICDDPGKRSDKEIRKRYQELIQLGRVEFVTFHQSYGYEEFVESLRPQAGEADGEETSGSGFFLEPVDGVLKRIAERARKAPGPSTVSFDLKKRNVFKMGLGNPSDPAEQGIFDECIENEYVLLGHGGDIDWSKGRFDQWDSILEHWKETKNKEATGHDPNVKFLACFKIRLKIGDLVIVPAPQQKFRAVGVITGEYEYEKRDDGTYFHRREVNWLWKDKTGGLPFSELYEYRITPQTIYQLSRENLRLERLQNYIGNPEPEAPKERLPHVLVIDEINRANVSKVMGELVTILEEDKREGAPHEIPVTLPHSGKSFTLPANVHILGTMNTADRSIALLDTALRRRFEFEEMAPDPKQLNTVDGINLPAVLEAMNNRLEWLLGRDHLIGHAWLMGAEDKTDVDRIMRRKIIPMLAEYFHDDWNKVRTVLGGADEFVRRDKIEPPPDLDSNTWETRYRWTPVEPPYQATAYDKLIGK